MIIVWIVLLGVMWWQYAYGIANPRVTGEYANVQAQTIVIRIFLILNGLFIGYFWLNGVKDFIYVVWYYCDKKRLERQYEGVSSICVDELTDKVVMLYCTCNDFDGNSLSSFLGLFGKKAVFVVTPKSSGKMTIRRAFALQYKEIIFSTVLIALASLCSYYGSGDILQGILAICLMSVTGYVSLMLPFFSNCRYDEQRMFAVDEQTKAITLSKNGLIRRTEDERRK